MKKLVYAVLLACLLCLSIPVHALALTANDPASLIAAITTANATPGADIITLTGNINLLTTDNTTTGNNALPVITQDLRINGAGFTISRDAGLPACNTIFPSVDRFRFFLLIS